MNADHQTKLKSWIRETDQNFNLHPNVASYLLFKPDDIEFNGDSHISSDNWKKVSDILNDCTNLSYSNMLKQIIETIGIAVANRFVEQQKRANRLPNPDDVLDGTVKSLTPPKSVDTAFFPIWLSALRCRLA